MTDEKTQRARGLSEELHRRETFERLIAQAKVEGMNLDALDDRALIESLAQLVRSRGHSPLADRLQATHDTFALANDRRVDTANEWDADAKSAEKEQRARDAQQAADEALDQLEQVVVAVRAFLETGRPE